MRVTSGASALTSVQERKVEAAGSPGPALPGAPRGAVRGERGAGMQQEGKKKEEKKKDGKGKGKGKGKNVLEERAFAF